MNTFKRSIVESEKETTTITLPNFQWESDAGLWASGEVCYLGKWRIGKVDWISRSQGDVEHEGAFIYLPGLKELQGYFSTKEEAKRRVETVALYWMKNLMTRRK